MSRYTPAARPLVQCLRAPPASVLPFRPATTPTTTTTTKPASAPFARSWSTTAARRQDGASKTSSTAPPAGEAALEGWELDPDQTTLPWAEKELMRRGTPPVGSRRRRAAVRAANALSTGAGPVPFELMPYHCFQEARKVLQADRDEKLKLIAAEAAKIRKLEIVVTDPQSELAGLPNTSRGGEAHRQLRLKSLRQQVEKLKVLADINDPQVKRRFEDGQGDMNKPIYRYLAEQRWRGRPFRLIQQRIEQFHITPDLLPASRLQPTADVELFFRNYRVAPGDIVDSLISEVCPRLRVQVFDRGTRLVSVVVVDADVPDWDNDSFMNRCHFLATNIPLGPAEPSVPLSRVDPTSQLVLPWLPAFAQKGSGPHRLAVLVLEQPTVLPDITADVDAAAPHSSTLDAAAIRASLQEAGRERFSVRHFSKNHNLTAVGCTLFRSQWDAGTEAVMERAGMPGAELELKPIRLPSLKPPRRARGWEARRQGPKFRHLWKFTHRIATPKRKFVR